ncbi:Fbd-associated f-box protein [Thalictrum thalictroides]|uniref:Fbd-associated f-box protein n=1 Tax=Thalictrum thalictroides TaxID=46969 RepID=A0A7J6WWF4_THATH|nr:Fbd-associated f-box protein [Thalictrum thalictroides]
MDDEDRISSLPEEIRNHIVSFLPMEQAIRTSILSTKWRKVCSSLSNFNFSHHDFRWKKEFNLEQFKEVVYQTLSRHDNSDIKQFLLSIDRIDDDDEDVIDEFEPHFNEWISFAVNHNVRELNVWGVQAGVIKQLSVCFVTSCNRLEELMLGYINLKLFTNVRFPNLTTLFLNKVDVSSVSVMNQFFSSCPVLEVLEMSSSSLEYKEKGEEDRSYDFILNIPSPNLKVLGISDLPRHGNHQIKILSKNLHKLGYHGGEPPSFGSNIIPSLDEATFDITTGLHSLNNTAGDNQWASKILTDLRSVTKLHLGTFYLEFLTREQGLLARLPTSYCSLKHLHLDLYPTKNQVEVITFLLRSYPNLQTLHISIKVQCGYNDYTFNMEEYWKTQELNTDGMLKQLRSVEIESFEGSEFELALVSSLLQNADVMEKMDILLSKKYQNDAASSLSIKEKIKMIASVSPNAAVSVLEIYSVNDFLAWKWARAKHERNSRREPRQ